MILKLYTCCSDLFISAVDIAVTNNDRNAATGGIWRIFKRFSIAVRLS